MIYRTTKSGTRPKHEHLIYIREVEGVDEATGQPTKTLEGVTTESNGHTHQVIVDENGVLTMLEGGKSLHTHELGDPVIYEIGKSEDDDMDETEKKAKYKAIIEEGEELEEESIEDGEESDDFYAGKQWSESDVAKLNAEDRPAITINEISAKVDLLCGFQRQNRTDVRFFPVESSDNGISSIATEVVKNIMESNNFSVVESEVFKDEVVVGRGLFHNYIDYNENMFGKIVVERIPWKSVHFGPHDKCDLSDCEYLTKKQLIPKKKLKLMYPKMKKEIDQLFASAERADYTSKFITNAGMEYREDGGIDLRKVIDTKKQMICVQEIWEKNYITALSVVNYDDAFVDTVSGLTESQIKQLEGIGIDVIKRTIFNMKVTVMAGDIILDERIEEQNFFPIVPVYAKRTSKGKFYGKVQDVKDIQREINKRHSQSLDIVNRVASYGFFYDDQTFDSTREEQQWRRDVSKPGWTAKVKNNGNIPVATQGTRMPTELVNMTQLASEKLNTVMNISKETLGFSDREVSSVAIIEKRRNVLTAQEFLFDNLAQGKKQLAKNILKTVQKLYSSDRLFRLIGNMQPQSEEEMAKAQKQQADIERFLKEVDMSELDVAVEVSASSPTTRSANFSLLLEMTKFGMPIPPDVLISSSDLPNKDEILGMIQAQQEAQAKSDSEKFDTEKEKVILSKMEGQQLQEYLASKGGGGIQGSTLTPQQQQLMNPQQQQGMM